MFLWKDTDLKLSEPPTSEQISTKLGNIPLIS